MSESEASPTLPNSPTLSIVVPIWNEEAVIPELYRRVVDVMAQIGESWELICVMTLKDRASEAIRKLPDDADVQQVMREVAFIAGIDQAAEELDRGEGLTAEEAREHLKKCLTR